MKIYPSALDLVAVLLVAGAVGAFVPTSCRIDHGQVPTENFLTVCFASEVDTEGISDSNPAFPYSDRQVRFAYDEWRLIYGKGDYNSERFNNFKTNHKTLTISNLKAREKAAKDGRPMPQWMSLNEYGDYSMDEYEAMMRGENPVVNGDQNLTDSSSNEGQVSVDESGEELIRGTQAIHNDYSMNYNNGQVKEYQDQFGRTIRSTQAVNKEVPLESAASTQTMDFDSNYANNINDADDSSRGTLIIPKGEVDNNQMSQRGTQVVGSSSQRGTQVVGSSSQRGTQVVGSSSQSGTQVVGNSSQRGTQVVSASAARGTEVIQPAYGANSKTGYGTQVVNGSGSRGTEVIQPALDPGKMEVQSTQGTQIIPRNNQGTQVVSQNLGNVFGGSENVGDDDNADVGRRGTLVIKRSIEVPEAKPRKSLFDIFFSDSTNEVKEEEATITEEPPKSNNFFSFLTGKDNTTVVEAAQEEEESNTGGGIFSLFGGNVLSSNSRPVRTTISLQKKTPPEKQTFGFQSKRKTKLVTEIENENGVPSILSFFGGAKKVDEEEAARNPNARATLVLKKPPKSQIWSPFSAKTKRTPAGSPFSAKKKEAPAESTPGKYQNDWIAAQIARNKEKEAKRKAEVAKQREQKRREAAQRLEAKKKAAGQTSDPKPPRTTSPFPFFGALGRQAEPPTLKKWRQNRDGTITGLIYDSKSFDDGTRITTSPVPRGAKRGTVVKTGGGSKYSLK